MTHWWKWVPGWVEAQGEGGFPARLLDSAAADGIRVWGVRRQEETTRLCCYARDYRRLRRPAGRACIRLRVHGRHGLPFLLFRYRRRKGLLVAAVLYAAILAVLAPRIWAIQVVGNVKTPTETVLAVAGTAGVHIGARTDRLDIRGLQIFGPDQTDTVAFITVNPAGSVARVEVTERKPTPSVLDLSEPSDLVAVRDGVIVSVDALSGYALVRAGEAVAAGTVLVTGIPPVPTEEEALTTPAIRPVCRAYGTVFAKTTRRLTVTVPLTYRRTVATGFRAFCPSVRFLCFTVPLFASATPEENALRLESRHFVRAGGLELPLGVNAVWYVRTATQSATRSEDEAAALAQKQLAQQERAVLGDCRHTETGRKTVVRGGQYVLTAIYSCEENIASERFSDMSAQKSP